MGYIDRNTDLTACYQAGDVFIFESRTETQGLVLLEAMIMGIPVVSTAVLGTKDVLVDGEGVLIAEEDIADFSEKIVKILQDPELKDSLSKKAEDYARAWKPDEMAKRM